MTLLFESVHEMRAAWNLFIQAKLVVIVEINLVFMFYYRRNDWCPLESWWDRIIVNQSHPSLVLYQVNLSFVNRSDQRVPLVHPCAKPVKENNVKKGDYLDDKNLVDSLRSAGRQIHNHDIRERVPIYWSWLFAF